MSFRLPSLRKDEPRVVVTGLGLVSAAGIGVDAAWRHAEAGVTALNPIHSFDPKPYGLELGGELAGLDRDPQTDRCFQILDLAVDELLRNAGWGAAEQGPRTAVVLGTCQGAIEGARDIHREYLRRPVPTATEAHREAFAHYRPGAGAARLASRIGAGGPRATLGMVCVSSAVAILHAVDLLRRGEAIRAVAGGFEGFSPFIVSGFHCIGALAAGKLRPFDEDRDGTVLGEGAALMTLETLGSAQARGATILAEVSGGGISADAVHMTAPDPEGRGLERAIRQAFRDAGVGPADIDYISAHGTGTRFNDGMECACYGRVFRELADLGRMPPVTGLKAIFGHTLGAAGALDALLSILAFSKGLLPPTASLETPLDGCEGWDFVSGPARAPTRPTDTILSCNSAFGGNNAALILSRFVEDPR